MPRFAAIDIGSNSIRMLTAEKDGQEPSRVLASDRQVVRLGTTVFREGKLSEASMQLGWQVLERMAAEYRKRDVQAVRAVGTSALRDASNADEFLQRAGEILGTPVEVISGLEEARLVQMGVQERWPQSKRVLIVDIGGGSAQLILAEHGHMVQAYSKPLGAVRLSEVFLKSDPPDPREIARMRRFIQERIEGPIERWKQHTIDAVIATSSTAAAIVCAANDIKRSRREDADRMRASSSRVHELAAMLADLRLEERAKVNGIGPRRAEIIVAGVTVLDEILQGFHLPRLFYSSAGVRDGIIADLARRRVGAEALRLDADRKRTVRAMVRQYEVSPRHVKKVADLGSMLFDALSPLHRLPSHCGQVLEAAAYLYNIGHFVNDARHHRHSQYLVANSDLPGFDDRERTMIANLCRYHRKSMPQATHDSFQAMLVEDRRTVEWLTPLLRLAVALDQSQEQRVDRVEARVVEGTVELRLISELDVDIEEWHVGQVAPVFQQVYGLPINVKR
jgi:exopolyphosphatase / guanosine-5'-triphosphate,3'-diphosphate pyrophosphatase